MNQSAMTGPCGLTVPEIIDLTGNLHRAAASMQLICSEQFIDACQDVVKVLNEDLRQDVASDLAPFCDARAFQEIKVALDALWNVRAVPNCVAIGWAEGPVLSEQPFKEFADDLRAALKHVQQERRATTTDAIKLAIWMYVILGLARVDRSAPARAPRQRRTKALWRP